ncbi:MAG: hypothetical protein LCH54_15585 [Bacteroidetes bacterium]|nr:hypothetical protein [Bacteroidota bacterium]
MNGKFFQVFKAGNYPQGNFSAEDVAAIVDRYDPTFLEAGISIDHAKTGPSWGWVAGLKDESGMLLAEFKDVVAEFQEAVNQKQYKRVSVEIFKSIDMPGKGPGPYLKAVSFLGIAAPAVKGLEPVAFAAGDDIELVTVEFAEDPQTMVMVSETEFKSFSDLAARVESLSADLQKAQGEIASFADMKAEVATAGSAKEVAEQRLRDQYLISRKNDMITWINERIAYGSVTPAQQEDLLKVLAALDNVVSFSEDGKVTEEPTGVVAFKSFIGSLPKLVSTETIAKKPGETAADDAGLASFGDATLDPERTELHRRVLKIQSEKNIPYDQALSLAVKQ